MPRLTAQELRRRACVHGQTWYLNQPDPGTLERTSLVRSNVPASSLPTYQPGTFQRRTLKESPKESSKENPTMKLTDEDARTDGRFLQSQDSTSTPAPDPEPVPRPKPARKPKELTLSQSTWQARQATKVLLTGVPQLKAKKLPRVVNRQDPAVKAARDARDARYAELKRLVDYWRGQYRMQAQARGIPLDPLLETQRERGWYWALRDLLFRESRPFPEIRIALARALEEKGFPVFYPGAFQKAYRRLADPYCWVGVWRSQEQVQALRDANAALVADRATLIARLDEQIELQLVHCIAAGHTPERLPF